MLAVRTHSLRRLATWPALAGHQRFCSSAPNSAELPKEEKPETPISAKAAQHAEVSIGGAAPLSRMVRAGVGGVGSILATAGVGGLAWMHWPLLGPSSMCAVAGTFGMAFLALAAKGEMPKMKEKSTTPKRKLELKLLNDKVHFKGDVDALTKLGSVRQWPQGVQTALAVADKAAETALKTSKEEQGKELLESVKKELEAGSSAEAVRQRLRPRLFVFDFKPGEDPMAARPQSMKTHLEMLANTVSFILASASKHDEVMLRLASPGGAVSTYGLAAAQLQRLRDAGVPLTVCVDTVAASGGYMMACVADHIIAAPFAMVGSIGVIAGIPNIHKVLERNDVEYTQMTAGKYKRTVNILTPNTEEGLAKFREDIDVIHVAFQDHIKQCRPGLDVEQVATGEVWLGVEALQKGLIDAIGTSDTHVRLKVEDGFDAIELTRPEKKKQGLSKLLEGLGGAEAIESLLSRTGHIARSMWTRLRGEAVAPRVEAPHLHGVSDQ